LKIYLDSTPNKTKKSNISAGLLLPLLEKVAVLLQ